MFGECGLYCDGKIVALICDDQLFLEPAEAGRAVVAAVTGGLPMPVPRPRFLISEEYRDDSEGSGQLVRIAAQALPAPKPSKPMPRQRQLAGASEPIRPLTQSRT